MFFFGFQAKMTYLQGGDHIIHALSKRELSVRPRGIQVLVEDLLAGIHVVGAISERWEYTANPV